MSHNRRLPGTSSKDRIRRVPVSKAAQNPGPVVNPALITKEMMFDDVLRACPSFKPKWEEFCQEWKEESDPPIYLALADLARHLIGLLENGEDKYLKAVFEIVERWHLNGDAYVREAATIGLLEDLQNTNLHATTKPDDFTPFLLPESKYWWDKVVLFWEKGQLIVDDR